MVTAGPGPLLRWPLLLLRVELVETNCCCERDECSTAHQMDMRFSADEVVLVRRDERQMFRIKGRRYGACVGLSQRFDDHGNCSCSVDHRAAFVVYRVE
jgi:hypothetical protein